MELFVTGSTPVAAENVVTTTTPELLPSLNVSNTIEPTITAVVNESPNAEPTITPLFNETTTTVPEGYGTIIAYVTPFEAPASSSTSDSDEYTGENSYKPQLTFISCSIDLSP